MDTRPKRLDETSLYAQSAKKITSNTKLLDSILVGITFVIASSPDHFPLVDDFGTRTAKSEAVGEIPALSIFFKEYEDHIDLIDIKVAPEDIPF